MLILPSRTECHGTHSLHSSVMLQTGLLIRKPLIRFPLPISRPPLPLRISNPLPGSGTHAPTALCKGGRDIPTPAIWTGKGSSATQCVLDLGNLGVNLRQLLLVAREGSGEE